MWLAAREARANKRRSEVERAGMLDGARITKNWDVIRLLSGK